MLLAEAKGVLPEANGCSSFSRWSAVKFFRAPDATKSSVLHLRTAQVPRAWPSSQPTEMSPGNLAIFCLRDKLQPTKTPQNYRSASSRPHSNHVRRTCPRRTVLPTRRHFRTLECQAGHEPSHEKRALFARRQERSQKNPSRQKLVPYSLYLRICVISLTAGSTLLEYCSSIQLTMYGSRGT